MNMHREPHRECQDVDMIVQTAFAIRDIAIKLKVFREKGLDSFDSESIVTPEDAKEREDGHDFLRLQTGLLIDKAKDLWVPSLTLAMTADPVIFGPSSKLQASDFEELKSWVGKCKLDNAWKMDKLLDGREMMSTFNVKGSQVGELVEIQKEWQLLNPTGSKSMCETYLRASMEK